MIFKSIETNHQDQNQLQQAEECEWLACLLKRSWFIENQLECPLNWSHLIKERRRGTQVLSIKSLVISGSYKDSADILKVIN